MDELESLKEEFKSHSAAGCPIKISAKPTSFGGERISKQTTSSPGHIELNASFDRDHVESLGVGPSGELDEPLVDPGIDYSIDQPADKQGAYQSLTPIRLSKA